MKRLLTILLLIVSVNVFGQIMPAPSGTLTPLTTNQAYFRASDSTYYFYNGTNYLWNYFLNKKQADKLYQPINSPSATPFSLSSGYGLVGSSFDGSVARTWTADTASAGGLVSKSRLATNLGGYVPSARTITINGATRDLSANRTFNVGTVLSVGATAGTGISISGSPITSSGSLTITNTAPDQTVTLTAGTGISTSGTYPNFTITNTSPSPANVSDSLLNKANKDFSNVASGAIANSKLANSTISGVSLGSNLNALTLGYGLTGTSYNGASAVATRVDTAAIQTVSNFFPKGDTRYAKGVGNAVLTTGNQSIAGTKTFSSTITGTVASGTAIAATGTGTGIITVNSTGSQGRISTADNKLVLAGASGDASLRAVTGGQLEIPALSGMGDVIAYANNSGLVGQLAIGTGLSLSGGVLSATGSGSGSIGGSGTSTYIPIFTGSAAIGNSIMTSTGTEVKLNGSAANLRVGSNASDYGTFNYSGGNTSVRNDWASTSAQLDLIANGVGMRIFGTGNTHVAYTTDQGYKFSVNGTTYFNGNSIVNGSSTATSFSGAGTGLTGTASGLNIGGNAATASNSALWANQSYSGSAPATVQYALVYDNTNAQWRLGSASNLQSFLGLGSNAYTSTTYLSGVSVASANGLTGSSSGGATPTLTLASTFNSPIVATVGGQFTGATTTGTGSTAVLSASPAFTGTPTAPTQTQGDNSNNIATTAYVDALGGTILGAQKQIATAYTNSSTSGVSTTSLFNHNIAQSNLSADGDRVDFNFAGIFAPTGDDKFVTISVGGNTIAISGNASNKSQWEFSGYLMRTTSTTFRIFIKGSIDNVPFSTILDRTVTDFNPLNFQVLGQTNDGADPVTLQIGYLQSRRAP